MPDHVTHHGAAPPSETAVAARAPDTERRLDRRTALKNIGALAGAAPAVTLLLTPSASRAYGSGGSPCEEDRHSHCSPGKGHYPDRPGNGHGWGHEPGHHGNAWGRDWSQGKPGKGPKKPAGREL